MSFYFARHGQTASNKLRVLQGCGIDGNLDIEGIAQAEFLAKQIAGIKFETVYLSSLKRAIQTAEIALRGLNYKFQVVDGLREWALGDWEGQPSLTYLPLFVGDGEPPGGEKRQEFYGRVEIALNSALENSGPQARPFLIVAHGGVWMVIQDLLGLPRFKIKNCGLVELTQINGLWQQRLLEPDQVVP